MKFPSLAKIFASQKRFDDPLRNAGAASAQSGCNTGPCRAVQELLRSTGGGFQLVAQELGLPGMMLLLEARVRRRG